MVDFNAYRELVDEVCTRKQTDTNDKFCWCPECKEINFWTYWQGKNCKDVKIMLVGQDWGNPNLPKNSQTIENIKNGKSYFFNQNETSCVKYQTDKSLFELFNAIGYKNIIENKYDDLFFTNFFLGYRSDGIRETGNMNRNIMMSDADYFTRLVSAINPRVIICLGKLTYECSVNALNSNDKFRVGSLNDYCNMINNGKNYTDISG